MEWIDRCVARPPQPGVLGDLDKVRQCLADANIELRSALLAEWVSVAADGYRERMADRMRDLRARAAEVDALETWLRTAEAARANVPGV